MIGTKMLIVRFKCARVSPLGSLNMKIISNIYTITIIVCRYYDRKKIKSQCSNVSNLLAVAEC